GQRAIALAVIFEPVLADEDDMGVSAPPPHQARAGLQHAVLADEDDMGVSAPPPHQARAGLQHAAGVERTSAFLELSRQDPKAAQQCAAGAAMGTLLQLIG